MAPKRGLGRGLDALIPNKAGSEKASQASEKEKSKKKAKAENKQKAEVKAAEKPAEKQPVKEVAKPAAKTETKPANKTETKPTAKAPAAKAPAVKPAAKTTEAKAPASKSTAAKTPAAKTPAEKAHAAKAPAAKPKAAETPAPKVQPEVAAAQDHVVMMKISQVEPNREQPRKEFDKEKLAELAESIRQYGVIQPLLVQKNDGYYEIIAGERRWRASKMAGLKEIPVIVRDYTEQEVVEISLIENIQREDLNPIEEANAYVRLMDEFHLTQEKIAERVSRSRAAVTNSIRLLRLPKEIREMLVCGDISEGHARTLLGIPSPEKQIEAARKVIAEGLSVRDTEKLAKTIMNPPVKRTKKPDLQNDLIYRDLENQLKSVLGTKVSISRKSGNKGKIEIEYYSAAELERLMDLIRQAGRQEDW